MISSLRLSLTDEELSRTMLTRAWGRAISYEWLADYKGKVGARVAAR